MNVQTALDFLEEYGFDRLTGTDPLVPPELETVGTGAGIWTSPHGGFDVEPIDTDFPLHEEIDDEPRLWDRPEAGALLEVLGDHPPFDGQGGGWLSGGSVWDAAAWYCPFHFYGADYGIYVRQDGIDALALRIATHIPWHQRHAFRASGALPGKLLRLLDRAATVCLYLHEAYHHKTESFATRLEIIERAPRYVPYEDSVYKPAQRPLSDDLIEEALAVADVLRRVSPGGDFATFDWGEVPTSAGAISVRHAVHVYLTVEIAGGALPPGYRRAADVLDRKHRIDADRLVGLQHRLQSVVQEATLRPLGNARYWNVASHLFRPLFNRRCVAFRLV